VEAYGKGHRRTANASGTRTTARVGTTGQGTRQPSLAEAVVGCHAGGSNGEDGRERGQALCGQSGNTSIRDARADAGEAQWRGWATTKGGAGRPLVSH
jgi:hypothetical protein